MRTMVEFNFNISIISTLLVENFLFSEMLRIILLISIIQDLPSGNTFDLLSRDDSGKFVVWMGGLGQNSLAQIIFL